MVNPNPGLITDAMWRLWEERPNPDWKLSGIYANKPGYHNTVNANLQHWPDNYSIKLSLDLVSENRNKARAIDLTMSDSEMVKWTTSMKRAFENPTDNRVSAVKEFYGTLDNKTVFGLSKDSVGGPIRRVTADLTHLWHGHTSIFTYFVNSWNSLLPLHSVWSGESYESWSMNKMALPRKGDIGEDVRYWQYIHNAVINTLEPKSPLLVIDGDYGPAVANAFQEFAKKLKVAGTYNGSYLSGWLATQYHKAFAVVSVPVPVIPTPDPVPVDVIKEAVNAWLQQNVSGNVKITGSIAGIVDLS